MAVGRIINPSVSDFNKGDEKGYFELNGSTIVILVKENILKIDEDIMSHMMRILKLKLDMVKQ